jgi:hypothetical protein
VYVFGIIVAISAFRRAKGDQDRRKMRAYLTAFAIRDSLFIVIFPQSEAGASDAFRRAVRMALETGPLTRARESDLARIGHPLGLTLPEAHDIMIEEEAKRA